MLKPTVGGYLDIHLTIVCLMLHKLELFHHLIEAYLEASISLFL